MPLDHRIHENINDDLRLRLFFNVIDGTNQQIPVHWHDHLELLFLKTGRLTASIYEATYDLLPGDIMLVNPRDPHFTVMHGDCCYYLLQIASQHLELITPDWNLLHFQEYIPQSDESDSLSQALTAIFNELFRLNESKGNDYRLLFLIQTYQMLHLLSTRCSSLLSAKNRGQVDRDLSRIEQSIQYVRHNFRDPISLQEVSSLLALTPEYFCRLFKKYTGQTFVTYVSQVRMLHFYQDLLQTDESITYLLDKNGITNYKGFMREFKEAYGATPHKLRIMNRSSDK